MYHWHPPCPEGRGFFALGVEAVLTLTEAASQPRWSVSVHRHWFHPIRDGLFSPSRMRRLRRLPASVLPNLAWLWATDRSITPTQSGRVAFWRRRPQANSTFPGRVVHLLEPNIRVVAGRAERMARIPPCRARLCACFRGIDHNRRHQPLKVRPTLFSTQHKS